MNSDDLIKFLIWTAFFALALFGIYTMLRRVGVLS